MAKNGKLSTKKRKAIAALLSTSTQEQAAAAAGVGHRTLCRWLAEDATFQAALAEAETEAISQAARLLAGGASEAVNALLSVMTDADATNKERVAAARAYLSALPPVRLLGSIEAKIAELEKLNK